MKLSVFTVATPDLQPEELAKAAADAGIEGIEWRFKEIPEEAAGEKPSFWRHNRCSMDPNGTQEDWLEFQQAADKHGRRSLAVVPYLTCGDVEATEKVMQAAKLIGASFIRAGIPGYDRKRNYNELYDQAVRYLHEVQDLAAAYGVKAVVETHHLTIAPSAGLTHRLVSHFNPQHIGVLYDPGNMVHEGYENYRMGLELLGPYLAHVHVKNGGYRKTPAEDGTSAAWSGEWVPLNQGAVPWKQVIQDLQSVGYEGYYGIEDFSGTFESREMLLRFAEQMKLWSEQKQNA
ncbi:xylose isomerase [Paenibacillus sp. LC231]|uniref:sugar phosphate isomerase/epimerase family protein n=1 Tax=unclassified Paenibacillus TaxID=185978 RepID=UPI0008DD15BB|nr:MULTISPECIES: sugar phosphate isomerase/epimerase family protein [unclassified Paenibacillus]MCT1397854.1 sugar phosphate isomerase/epimerase [Paenibacillus sp. p3-SID867]OIA99876.1 xylose isomerase [Paenibacillus sp. LC231]